MIESIFVIIILAFIFFGALQLSQLFAAREINRHAANAGVRAKAVGLNDFMVHKVVKVASIPNAGLMTAPGYVPNGGHSAFWYRHASVAHQWNSAMAANPGSPQYRVEKTQIPLYLGAQNYGHLNSILNYEDFNTITHTDSNNGDTIEVRTYQDYPLRMPFHDWFYNAPDFPLQSRAFHADHYSLYLE